MDRNRETRRANIVGSNGFKRRRHRTNSLRASPDKDLAAELQESVRLRDRVKKDRERDRERERDSRERSNRSKRRRADRLLNNREDTGGDDTSDENSVNDDEDDEDEENPTTVTGGGIRLIPPALGSVSNHHHGHVINHSSLGQPQHSSSSNSNHLQHRKTFPSSSSSKIFKAAPVWKPGDEMIGVSVPRKARSACTKRSHHEWISSSSNNNSAGGVTGDQIHIQASSSPTRHGPVSTSAPSPVTPVSPSSSNISSRKNLRLHNGSNNGPMLKPSKGSRISSSNPEELEIEIAEVLFGLKTQGPSLKIEENRSRKEAKFLVSSPNSNLISANNLLVLTPLSVVAPKRKRPRQVLENPCHGARNSSFLEKPDMVQTAKSEVSSPKLEKVSGSTTENGGELGSDMVQLERPQEHLLELKPPDFVMTRGNELASTVKELKDGADLVKDEDMISVMVKESSVAKTEDCCRVESTLTATVLADVTVIKATELDNQREKKFFIELMATPPERETKFALDQKPAPSIIAGELKSLLLKEKSGIEEVKKIRILAEEDEALEPCGNNNVRNIAVEKTERGISGVDSVKISKEDTFSGKSVPVTSSLPLPIANWPEGLRPMGYMTPLPGIVSIDGSTVSTTPIQPQLTQPQLKRCATHCSIARNISYIQQFMKMNPFWTAAASNASLFVSNPYGFNEHSGNEKNSQTSQLDSVQRKQPILLQQSLPSVDPNNLMGPAFISPLNEQQAAVAASSRSGATKSHCAAGQSSSSTSSSPAVSSSTIATTAVGFNYPNMGSNETQYLAILQNNAYPFPIPAVGAPPNFRGSHAQVMPFFNGTFYPSQMIHLSQLQHQQTIIQRSTQSQQVHHNASTSSVSAQKHLHSFQQKLESSGANVAPGSSTLQNFPAQKSHSSQQSVARNNENEAGCEESLSTTDNRGSWASVNMYGQNFAMPIHPQNFAFMAAPSATAVGTVNQGEKPLQQQHQGLKPGVSSIPPHSFAMSFNPMNGSAPGPGVDLSMAQNHPIFHSFPDSTQQNIQTIAVASAASQVSQKKSCRISEDVKPGGGDSTAVDEERRKGQAGVGHTIAFTRSDPTDTSSTSIQTNNVVDVPSQALNPSSGPVRSSRSMISKDAVAMNIQNAHLQAQQKQKQMLQMMQQQQQQQQLVAASVSNRSKAPSGNSNGGIFSEPLNSTSLTAKFPNALTGLAPNNVRNNSGIASQSHQWKNSSRTPTSQSASPMASVTGSTFNSLPQQQHSRNQPQMPNQISFGGSQKAPLTSQGQLGNLAPSPVAVGSPSTSSISKGSNGSPRTITPSPSNKIVQTSSLSSQPPKHSPSVPGHKSLSILGNASHATTCSSGTKPHIQQPHQQLAKNAQQTQFFFSNPYSQVQSPQSTGVSSSSPGGFYIQKRLTDQNVQPTQQLPGATSTGVLPPASLSSASTNDPAKAIAASTCNAKGGALASVQLAADLLPAGFSYVHPIPAVVQVKSPEQKQTAGNDTLQPWQSEKK